MRAGRGDGDGRLREPDDRTAKIQPLRPTSLLRLHADRAKGEPQAHSEADGGYETVEMTLNVYGQVSSVSRAHA
jgi:hypothetical protein